MIPVIEPKTEAVEPTGIAIQIGSSAPCCDTITEGEL
jgi:hypothetical protein